MSIDRRSNVLTHRISKALATGLLAAAALAATATAAPPQNCTPFSHTLDAHAGPSCGGALRRAAVLRQASRGDVR
jgi:hypothetical protein